MNHIERFRQLTAREREVLDLFCQGLLYRDIGERLFISVKGVKSHMQHIYQKLGLMHLPPKARAFTLREEYWPLVQSEPQAAQAVEPDVEIVDQIEPEVEALIDQDEATMKALVVTEPPKLVPPPRRRSRLACFPLTLIMLVVVAAAFWYFDGLSLIQGAFAQPQSIATDTEPALTVVEVQETPTLTPSQTQSATSVPSDTPLPSATYTLTPRSSATPNFGPVYEVEDWHKEGDLWFRLFDWHIDDERIFLLVELWNQSNQDHYFRWDPNQNGFLEDNLGVKYSINNWFDYGPWDEIVSAGEKIFITYGNYTDVTFVYDSDDLFSPGVTDLYFTLEYFSDIERATWHISVGN
ncbi:MAG: hypothetical protein KF821_02090 [Anaerolineales bacterium]|nr:hypothetical protein [Anaerolineales bacterium]